MSAENVRPTDGSDAHRQEAKRFTAARKAWEEHLSVSFGTRELRPTTPVYEDWLALPSDGPP